MTLPRLPRHHGRLRFRGKCLKSYIRRRVRLYIAQGGKCKACRVPMWETRVEHVQAYKRRMLRERNEKISVKRIKRDRRASIDHFIPRSQGGTYSDPRNVVLCQKCNADRGDTPWEDFINTFRTE